MREIADFASLNSEIFFGGANKKVYVFMSSEPSSNVFPSELTFKYMVSKVLVKGVCGEVRLCFRISDLHSVAINLFGGGRFRGMLNFAYKGGGGLRHMLKIAVKRGGGGV